MGRAVNGDLVTALPDVALQASPGLRLMHRLDMFARHSDEPGKLTRLYLSPAHSAAARELIGWMRAAGMTAGLDAIGNVVGRYEGAEPGAPALIIGSHIDTVRDAGRYDGNLGVLAGLACVEELARRGQRLPFAIEVIGFGDEEGVRFPSTLAGSRALAGVFDRAKLKDRDQDGIRLEEALLAFGCDPRAVGSVARRPQDVLAYVELHIEQGPVLEANDRALGIVTAISGATRFAVEIGGTPGHAGTVPMHLRKDALTAAAEMILAIEARARSTADLVATVGQIQARAGAANVIAGHAQFTIDLRSGDDKTRERAVAKLTAELHMIAERRGVRLEMRTTHDAAASRCDDRITGDLAAATARAGERPLFLPSGAGHDAMVIGGLCPMGMLFVRCTGGISHNPAEAISVQDAEIAIRVLSDFIASLEPADYRGSRR